MFKARSRRLKLLIMAGLLAAAGLVIILSSGGLLAILLSIAGLAALLWFTREPRPQGELPCASVSCCHYLENHEEERTQHPQ